MEDPEGQALHDLHRALVGQGSDMTVFEMRQALRKSDGNGGILERVEAMSAKARELVGLIMS